MQAGVATVVCESLNQVRWLNEVAKDMAIRPDVLLRVQLDWDEGSSVLGGNDITPFGIDINQWQQLSAGDYDALTLRGFHVFQWGNILSIDRLESIWRLIMQQMTELTNLLQIEAAVIDLGGGLGIPYSDDEQPLEFNKVAELLQQLHTEFPFDEIWLELGRYMVGDFGQYITQVIDRKTVRGKELLVTEGGMNHIARPALTGQAFPCDNLSKSAQAECMFQIHGPLCTALDKLGTMLLPGDTQPGDWLVMNQAGAYGMTESMPYFLCHDLPAEVIASNGKIDVIQPTQAASAWVR
jgi:diaminopimelate decarboxylase